MECIKFEVRFPTGVANRSSLIAHLPFPKCSEQVYVCRNKEVKTLDGDTDIISAGYSVLIPVHQSDNIEKIEDSLAVCLEEKYDISFIYRVSSRCGEIWKYNIVGFGKNLDKHD